MLQFFSLLAVDEVGAEKPLNAKSGAGDESLLLYLRCASTLSGSLRAHSGAGLTVLTNDVARLRRVSASAGINGIAFVDIPCTHDGPQGSTFRLALHKLDALVHLSTQDDATGCVLLDLDMFATADLNAPFEAALERAELALYEITAQDVPAYGARVVSGDLTATAGRPVPMRWFGGEVLAARPPALRRLLPFLEECYTRYLEIWPTLHHNGDEVIVSAAIQLLSMDGLTTEDLGSACVLRRFWSVKPRSDASRVSDLFSYPLLHLPADKEFLAGVADPAEPRTVRRQYRAARIYAPAQVLRRASRRPLAQRLGLRRGRG
jgi:hypothetical protein